jgi:hypothetical protein
VLTRQRNEGNPNPPEQNPNFSERNPSRVEQIPNRAEQNPNSNPSISFAESSTYADRPDILHLSSRYRP